MCGIAGMLNRRRAVEECEITRMSELLEHRGPDDAGQILLRTGWDGPEGPADLALANRRLAILDLSAQGHQPMTRDDCTIVYNGEVYNYIEIRSELAALGRKFDSTSDTEVILQAYIEWGPKALEKFNGIFAFAIWNGRDRELFCARDRLGVKPFYYYLDETQFLFASEIKSILSTLGRQPGLNQALVYDFLTADYMDHTDGTFFDGVMKLPAGSYLLMSSRRPVIHQYWSLEATTRSCQSIETNVELFSELFMDAVRLQMRSDVPIACCLSGGMDSSAIVTMASKRTSTPMETFTARYEDRSMDEFRYAEAVVRRSGVRSTSMVAAPKDFWEHLPQIVRTQEEPFGGPSVYSQWLLMQTIHAKGIKVVLDGQGGDELLCGYAKYFYFYLSELWSARRFGRLFETGLVALSNAGAHIFNLQASRRYLPRFLKKKPNMFQPAFLANVPHSDCVRAGGDVRAQQLQDILKFSLPVLLRFEDKNSMAHSVESRVPFLDHRLVEFSLSLPTDQKLYGARAKLVMRKALGQHMPPEILNRRSKLGFGGTFESWVRELTPQFTRWLQSAALPVDRYVRREYLFHLLKNRDPRLFRTLVLDVWLKEFGYSN